MNNKNIACYIRLSNFEIYSRIRKLHTQTVKLYDCYWIQSTTDVISISRFILLK